MAKLSRSIAIAVFFAFGISNGLWSFAAPTYSYGPEGIIVPAAGNPPNPHCPLNSTPVLASSQEYQSNMLACSNISGAFSIVGTNTWYIEGSQVTYKCIRCDCFNPNPPHNQMTSDSCFASGVAKATSPSSTCDAAATDSLGSSGGTTCAHNETTVDDKTPVKPTTTTSTSTKKDATTTAAAPTGNQTTDQQTCQQKATDATQCCQNPMSCLNTAIQLGYVNAGDAALAQAYSSGALTTNQATIQQSCTQLQQASVAMQNVNSGLSALCYARKSACGTTCQGFKQTYSSSAFDGAINACSALTQNVAALGQSANQNVSNAMAAQQCQQMTAASANATNPMSTSPVTTPTTQSADSGTSGSTGLDAAAGHSDPGLFTQQPITGSYSGTDPSSFDVGTTGGDGTQQQPSIPVAEGEPTSATVVPNNTGGALPGSSSDGANSGTNNGSSSNQQASTGNGASADVLHGNRSGGGFVSGGGSSSGGSGFDNGSDGSGFNFGKFAGKFGKKAAGQDLSKYRGLDLKQYLPGGALDPHRGLASVGRGQIRPSGDDLFIAITSRIKLMCKLGHLIDCR